MDRETFRRYGERFALISLSTGSILLASGCGDVIVGETKYRNGTAERQVYKAEDVPETSYPDDKKRGELDHTEYFHCEQNENGLWEVVEEEQPAEGRYEEVSRYFSKICHDGTIAFPDIP